jgi:DNA-binding MurR/RpiR family transcriptional regulator
VTDVAGRIRRQPDQLPPNDLRIAHRLLDHPSEAPFEAESLAAASGGSQAAVERFSGSGSSGFAELHDPLRAELWRGCHCLPSHRTATLGPGTGVASVTGP